jgi:hypothetical protein
MGEQIAKVVKSSDRNILLLFPFLWPQVLLASGALGVLASSGVSAASQPNSLD